MASLVAHLKTDSLSQEGPWDTAYLKRCKLIPQQPCGKCSVKVRASSNKITLHFGRMSFLALGQLAILRAMEGESRDTFEGKVRL